MKYTVSNLEAKRLKGRTVYKISCSFCGADTWKREYFIMAHDNHFCSIECLGESRKTGVTINCKKCGKEFYRTLAEYNKVKNHYCSKSCAISASNKLRLKEKHPNYKDGKASYRSWAFDHYGKECQNNTCKLIEANIPMIEEELDVHHIDGDRLNNSLENLIVLCVLCHARVTRNVED